MILAHKRLLAKALLLGALPVLASPADCLKGLKEVSLDNQLPTRVHNQRNQGMCYAHAWSLLADAALFRKTQKIHDISPEFGVCQYLRASDPASLMQRRNEVITHRLKGDKGWNLGSDGAPEALLAKSVRGNLPVAVESKDTASDLMKVLRQLDSAAMAGELYSEQEVCSILDSGVQNCIQKGSVKLQKDAFLGMKAQVISVETQVMWKKAADQFTDQARALLTSKGPAAEASNEYQRVTRDCEASSEGVRQTALRYLCAGIPVMARTTLGNVGVAPLGSRSYRTEPFPKDLSQIKEHQMLLTGVEIDAFTKKPTFIFRNSEGPTSAKVRIPFSEACRIWGLSWLLVGDDEKKLGASKAGIDPALAPVDLH